jgi:uncharacterized Fe-S cluster protein YjdI
VRRWRATVIDIAVDEMLHLALVNNLLISLGATPHYGRFNFPINPGVFPADVAVALAPLDPDMLDHFIYLERPRDSAERDGAIISKAHYHRGVIEGRLMPFADDYDTVGELYEGIAASFAARDRKSRRAASGSWQRGVRLDAATDDFHGDDSRCPRAERPAAADQVLLLMRAVTAIGSRLAELPARPGENSSTAGLTFTLSRGPLGFGSAQSARTLLAERSRALAQRFRSLASEVPELPPLADQMDRFVAHWSTMSESASSGGAGAAGTPAVGTVPPAAATASATAATASSAGATAAAAVAAPASSHKVDVAVGGEVTIRFDHSRCVHSRACVLGEPNVFKANTPGEWIYPDQATVQRLAIVANNCPSGAISLQAKDPSRNETPPLVNLVRIRENGPLAFHATLEIDGRADGFRATLCRCGQSQNKP